MAPSPATPARLARRAVRARPLAAALAALAACALPAVAHAESAPAALDPTPTAPWLAGNLVPAPGLAVDGDGQVRGLLGWRVSPLVYAFATHPRVRPVHVLVVPPFARYAGSLALDLGLEWVVGERLLGRATFETMLPVVRRGEYLAVSFGAGALAFGERTRGVATAGVHVLYGVVGLRVLASPDGPLTLGGGLTWRWF